MGEELTPLALKMLSSSILIAPNLGTIVLISMEKVVSYPSFKNLTIREERVVKIPSPKIPT